MLGVLLRAEPWASGVTCPGDVEVAAPLVVGGSGVYVGGCLRGRENVSFEEAAGAVPGLVAGGPADVVHGETFPIGGRARRRRHLRAGRRDPRGA